MEIFKTGKKSKTNSIENNLNEYSCNDNYRNACWLSHGWKNNVRNISRNIWYKNEVELLDIIVGAVTFKSSFKTNKNNVADEIAHCYEEYIKKEELNSYACILLLVQIMELAHLKKFTKSFSYLFFLAVNKLLAVN